MPTSDSVPEIPFEFWGQGAMANSVGYTELVFSVLDRSFNLLLLGLSSLSSSISASTDEDTADLGEAQYFLGTYGGGRGVAIIVVTLARVAPLCRRPPL